MRNFFLRIFLLLSFAVGFNPADAATFRNATSNSASAATLTINKPTGVVANDVQYMLIQRDGTIAAPYVITGTGQASWTLLKTAQVVTNGDQATIALYRQVAGATEPSSYLITPNDGGSNAFGAILVAYSGVDTTTPEDASSVINPNSSSVPASPVTMTSTAITTTAVNETILYIGGVDMDNTTAVSFTDPASYTRRIALTPANFTNGYAADIVQAGTGTTGTPAAVATASGEHGNYVVFLVALKNSTSPATATTLTGPTSGVVGVASSNFTVGANGTITGTVIVTPSDSGAGGTFTPTTVSISSGSPTGTFTYTAASVGAKTISTTNNGSLSNPSNITYTASASATGNSGFIGFFQ